jgi:hypothetical protein
MSKVKTALDLAAWLEHMRRSHEESIARDDVFLKNHIQNLREWEWMVRAFAAELDQAEQKA